ncbi:MAG: hypothetical protein AAF745_07880 [Planctomycetota bacterium]
MKKMIRLPFVLRLGETDNRVLGAANSDPGTTGAPHEMPTPAAAAWSKFRRLSMSISLAGDRGWDVLGEESLTGS